MRQLVKGVYPALELGGAFGCTDEYIKSIHGQQAERHKLSTFHPPNISSTRLWLCAKHTHNKIPRVSHCGVILEYMNNFCGGIFMRSAQMITRESGPYSDNTMAWQPEREGRSPHPDVYNTKWDQFDIIPMPNLNEILNKDNVTKQDAHAWLVQQMAYSLVTFCYSRRKSLFHAVDANAERWTAKIAQATQDTFGLKSVSFPCWSPSMWGSTLKDHHLLDLTISGGQFYFTQVNSSTTVFANANSGTQGCIHYTTYWDGAWMNDRKYTQMPKVCVDGLRSKQYMALAPYGWWYA